jgi:hypothetical protein
MTSTSNTIIPITISSVNDNNISTPIKKEIEKPHPYKLLECLLRVTIIIIILVAIIFFLKTRIK